MRKILLVVSVIILSLGLVSAKDISTTTDYCENYSPIKLPNAGPSDVIDYTIEWALPVHHIATVAVTPVCIGTYPAGETLMWVASGGRTGSGDPNWMLIYNLNTRQLVDSFQQVPTTTWGYRDMCFYNGFVYAGTEATLHKISPVPPYTVVGTYSVTGISGSVIRALADNDIIAQDSLYTTNWAVPIYKFPATGGPVRTVASNTYSIYGLAYDRNGFVWGSSQTTGAHLVKYNYPDFTVADFTAIPELGSGIAGGCEMWKDTFLLYLSQAVADSVVCIRLYTTPLTNDVGVDVILSPGSTHLVNTSMTPSARIKNYGTATQSFVVRCSIINSAGVVRHLNQQSVTDLAGGNTVNLNFGSWIPTVSENLTVFVTTYLAGDENPVNDQKTRTCEVGPYIIIGTGTATSYLNPINRYYNYSVSEGIYLQSEIGIAGTILNLGYYKGSGTDLNPIDSVYIYLKHTTATSLATGTFAFTDYTLVYSGQYPNNIPEGWLAVDLQTPFYYNNTDNLAILVVKYYQPYISTTASPNWRYTSTSTNLSRIYYSDITRPVPGTSSLTATLNRPNLRLSIIPPSANDVGVDAILSPGAQHAVNTLMTPSARIRNFGTQPQYDFKVHCEILGPGSVQRYRDSVTVSSLGPGLNTNVNFPSWLPTNVEMTTVNIWTALEGDEYPANDLKTRSTNIFEFIDAAVTAITRPLTTEQKRVPFIPQVTVANNGSYSADVPVIAEIYSLILQEGFEGMTFPPPGWDTVRLYGTSAYNQWSRQTSGTTPSCSPRSGVGMARYYSYLASAGNASRLITPNINLTLNTTLAFFMYQDPGYNPNQDTLDIDVFDGANWINVARFDRYGTPAQWVPRTVDLSPFTGGTIRIGFTGRSGYGNNIFIDDIAILPVLYRDSVSVTVGAGKASAEAFFKPCTLFTEGTYGFNTYTKLAGDMVPTNNSRQQAFTCALIPLNLVSPQNGAEFQNRTPTFVWTAVDGATSYRIQIANNPDFNPVLLQDVSSTTSWAVAEEDALADGIYYWRVRTEAPGTPDPYSASRMFKVDNVGPIAPTLTSPSGLINDNTPTFVWQAVSDAVLYNLVVETGKEVVIDITLDVTTFTPEEPIDDGGYIWKVRARDLATNWGDFADPMEFIIDVTPPAAPELIGPSGIISDLTPTFEWEEVSDAMLYNLVVETGKEIVFDETLEVTTFTPEEPMAEGPYSWKVKSKDLAGNWGDFSEPMTFTIYTGPPAITGWAQLESMPTLILPKYVKDGGAITAASAGEKTMSLFAFRGQKSKEFYKYTPGTPGTWTLMESIPFGYKPGTSTINKKTPGKGAALCWDGANTIYATKGNSTYEFWAYDIPTNAWTQKAYVPAAKPLKGGTSLVFKDGKVYLLAGGQKPDVPTNFFEFTPNADSGIWAQKPTALLIPDNKVYKDGSCLTILGTTIYALKGGGAHNYFYKFDGTAWTHLELETIPLLHPQTGTKKIKVKDGGAMTSDGSVIYAIKGGGAQQFWKYTPGAPVVWTGLDTIPKLHKKSVPKTGAGLAYAYARVYLLKGNNTPEFWQYGPPTAFASAEVTPLTNTAVMTQTSLSNLSFKFDVNPNPFNKLTTIRYTVPISGNVAIRLYNATGRLIETITNEYHNAGSYTKALSAKNLTKGIYFLKYESATDKAELKLIVQ